MFVFPSNFSFNTYRRDGRSPRQDRERSSSQAVRKMDSKQKQPRSHSEIWTRATTSPGAKAALSSRQKDKQKPRIHRSRNRDESSSRSTLQVGSRVSKHSSSPSHKTRASRSQRRKKDTRK